VVRLLFPDQEISIISSESVKLKMDSILPLSDWKYLEKLNGRKFSTEETYLSIDEVGEILGTPSSHLIALLLCEGVVRIDFSNGSYPVSSLIQWLPQIGLAVPGAVSIGLKKKSWWRLGD
jgi:hypothetical protein